MAVKKPETHQNEKNICYLGNSLNPAPGGSKRAPAVLRHIIPTLHIMGGTIKAHIICVGQTNPQIIRSKVLSPLSKGKPKVAILQVD